MKKDFLILCVQQSGPIVSKIDAEEIKIPSALVTGTIRLDCWTHNNILLSIFNFFFNFQKIKLGYY